jgi:hypothetical protein
MEPISLCSVSSRTTAPCSACARAQSEDIAYEFRPSSLSIRYRAILLHTLSVLTLESIVLENGLLLYVEHRSVVPLRGVLRKIMRVEWMLLFRVTCNRWDSSSKLTPTQTSSPPCGGRCLRDCSTMQRGEPVEKVSTGSMAAVKKCSCIHRRSL